MIKPRIFQPLGAAFALLLPILGVTAANSLSSQKTTISSKQTADLMEQAQAISTPNSKYSTVTNRRLSATAQRLATLGYENVADHAPSVVVSLMYARPDNFVGKVLYGDLREAYLHPKAMAALVKAQNRLAELRPDLRLIVFDAARPMAIQQRMWNAVKGTSKDIYVSNPAHGGGMHNYGMAVDISLCKANGDTIDMGTKVDYMGIEAHIDREAALVAQHRISRQAQKNRELLRQVMRYGGWHPLRTEWWHFNMCTRAEAKRYYKVIR